MLTTFDQRARREGIVLRKFSLPVPLANPDDVIRLFKKNITDQTRLILMCHMINLTGQVLPVRGVVEMARRRGIPVIVDGAHAFAHLPFRHEELDCDFYGTSLHKWLLAPHGTGMLYVRRSRIAELWPLMATPASMNDNIRKFEEIGTHPAANVLAIGEAIAFHQSLGAERKAARLRYQRDYWLQPFIGHERIRINTNLDPANSGAIANIQVAGVDSGQLSDYLWHEHRIIVAGIIHEDFEGIRVSPNLLTTLAELNRLVAVIGQVLSDGIPAVSRNY
jgi:selenocysteine lyase/cysteine desulfurase